MLLSGCHVHGRKDLETVPGAVKESFREEAMPEPSVMSLIQLHLNVSEIVYISLSLALKHTHTDTHTQILLLYYYSLWIHLFDLPHLFTETSGLHW